MCVANSAAHANFSPPTDSPPVAAVSMPMRLFSLIRLVGLTVVLMPGTTLIRAESRKSDNDFDFYISTRGRRQLVWPFVRTKCGAEQMAHLRRWKKPRSSPCGTIEKAHGQDPRRSSRRQLSLGKTVVFSMQDSAGKEGSTTYSAYPGETPILTSGVPIKGWKQLDALPKSAAAVAAKHLWSSGCARTADERALALRRIEASTQSTGRGFTPPHGWKDDAAGRGPSDIFYFPKGIVDTYSDFRGAELLVMPTANYEMNILPIAFVDRKRLLGVTQGLASRPIGPMQFHSETMWIENRIEDLDKPGEWVFDAENRRIILWPTTDTPSKEIVAPLLTELVRIEGAIDYAGPTDEPVRNVNFHGLTFAHAERLPRPGQDGWDLQHSWEYFDCPSALLRFRGAENCSVEGCRFVASGGAACGWISIVSTIEFANCEIGQLGGVGVLLAGYGPGTKGRESRKPSRQQLDPSHRRIELVLAGNFRLAERPK